MSKEDTGVAVGDIVYLKSGGPAMTLRSKNAEGNCFCEWFIKDEELKSGSFLEITLTKENPKLVRSKSLVENLKSLYSKLINCKSPPTRDF